MWVLLRYTHIRFLSGPTNKASNYVSSVNVMLHSSMEARYCSRILNFRTHHARHWRSNGGMTSDI